MEQVKEAIGAVELAGDNYQLVRALETAIAVCYVRPFTGGKFVKLDESTDIPTAGTPERGVHDELIRVRQKVYAHIDKASGRDASIELVTLDDGTQVFTFTEKWLPMDRQRLPAIRELAVGLRDEFRNEAIGIEAQLRAAGEN